MNNWSLAAVAEFVADANLDRYTYACLPFPHPGIWPDQEGQFPQLAELIEQALPGRRKRTFYQTLLASFLMAPEFSPECLPEWLSQRISIRELAEMIASKVAFTGVIKWDTSKPDGMLKKCMDVSRMKAIGFAPKITLSEGVEQMIEIYKSQKTVTTKFEL